MSDWIEHDGKGMPIDGEIRVHVKFRDGSESYREYPWLARMWGSNWEHYPDHHEADIVAYRIIANPDSTLTPP